MNKQLLKIPTVIRKEDIIDDGFHYVYLLTMHEDPSSTTHGAPTYSIKVEMTDNCEKTTSALIPSVFSSREKADLFFDKLVRNLATPIDLPYVFEDEI